MKEAIITGIILKEDSKHEADFELVYDRQKDLLYIYIDGAEIGKMNWSSNVEKVFRRALEIWEFSSIEPKHWIGETASELNFLHRQLAIEFSCDCCDSTFLVTDNSPHIVYPHVDHEGTEVVYTFCTTCFLKNRNKPLEEWECSSLDWNNWEEEAEEA